MTKAGFDAYVAMISSIAGFMMPGQERWLFHATRQLPEGARIVEIGSYMGRSTAAMAYATHGKSIEINSIDTFSGNDEDFIKGEKGVDWRNAGFKDQFVSNLRQRGLDRDLAVHQGLSHDIGKTWRAPIDFLLIDGSHVYEDVKRDADLFLPHLRPGGVLVMHDVIPEWPGPLRVWREDVRPQLENCGHYLSFAFGRKPSNDEFPAPSVHDAGGGSLPMVAYLVSETWVRRTVRTARSLLPGFSGAAIALRIADNSFGTGEIKAQFQDDAHVSVLEREGGEPSHLGLRELLNAPCDPETPVIIADNRIQFQPGSLAVLVAEYQNLRSECEAFILSPCLTHQDGPMPGNPGLTPFAGAERLTAGLDLTARVDSLLPYCFMTSHRMALELSTKVEGVLTALELAHAMLSIAQDQGTPLYQCYRTSQLLYP